MKVKGGLYFYLYFNMSPSFLQVRVNNGLTNNANEYEICFSASNVILPTSGYIGISAATGGLAGTFIAFITYI